MGITRKGLKVHKKVIALYAQGYGIEASVDGKIWKKALLPDFSVHSKYRPVIPSYLKITNPPKNHPERKGMVCKVLDKTILITPMGPSVKADCRHILGETPGHHILCVENCVPATLGDFIEAYPSVEVSRKEIAELFDVPENAITLV